MVFYSKKVFFKITILVLSQMLAVAQDFYPLVTTDAYEYTREAKVIGQNKVLILQTRFSKADNANIDLAYDHLKQELPKIDSAFSIIHLYDINVIHLKSKKFNCLKDSIFFYQSFQIDKTKKLIILAGNLITASHHTKKIVLLDFDLNLVNELILDPNLNFSKSSYVSHFVLNHRNNLIIRGDDSSIYEIDLNGNLVQSASQIILPNRTIWQNPIGHHYFTINPIGSGNVHAMDTNFNPVKTFKELNQTGIFFKSDYISFVPNQSYVLLSALTLDSCQMKEKAIILKYDLLEDYERTVFYEDESNFCASKRSANIGIDIYYEDYIFFTNTINYCGFLAYENCESQYIEIKSINQNGELRWFKYLGGDALYRADAIIATPDSGCIVFISKHDPEQNGKLESDLYYTKLDKNGNIVKPTPVSILETNTNHPTKPHIYPNPTKDLMYLNNLPKTTKPLQIEMFDLNGKQVLSAKINNNPIQIAHLPKGMYTYVLKQNEQWLSGDKLLKF